MSDISKLEGHVRKYKDAKTNVQNTINKLTEIKGILEDKSKFNVSYADRIIDDIVNAISNLKTTKSKIDSAVLSIESEIRQLKRELNQNVDIE